MLDRLKNLLREPCPNCESAYTGGHPDPDNRGWCVLCSDPKTGEMRGWVWRWTWLHQFLTSRHNWALVDLAHRLDLLRAAHRSARR